MISPAHPNLKLRHWAQCAVLWAGIGLMWALPVQAQTSGVMDHPRAFADFNHHRGYDLIDPARHGTPRDPFLNEMGALLMTAMFRTICLGLEDGLSLAAVTPDGFAPYDGAPYDLGPDVPPNGRMTVLSLTGDGIEDDDAGNMSVTLTPAANGMKCRVNWRLKAEPEPDRMAAMADVLTIWLPYTLSAVQHTHPYRGGSVLPGVFSEWDRPCGDRWCAVTLLGSIKGGRDVSVTTVLNITDIEGDRP